MSLSHLQKNEEKAQNKGKKEAPMVRQLTARPTSIILKLISFWILFSHPKKKKTKTVIIKYKFFLFFIIFLKMGFFFDTEDFVLIFF